MVWESVILSNVGCWLLPALERSKEDLPTAEVKAKEPQKEEKRSWLDNQPRRMEQFMKTSLDETHAAHDTAAAGAVIYNKLVLSVYDWFVLRFSNSLVWRCPSQLMLDFYNTHISAKHLDVGVGTGYFLDKCRFPHPPTIALMDLNPNSLQATARRLRRYSPRMYAANVLEPLEIEPAGFESVGLNYLLHCLPGAMLTKGVVFSNLKPLLNQGSVVFGTTILGQGVWHNFLGRALMGIYNARGIFSNTRDNLADLESILRENLRDCSSWVVGCAAFFVGRA